MSRIFSAIQKAEGDLASIAQQVLAGEVAEDLPASPGAPLLAAREEDEVDEVEMAAPVAAPPASCSETPAARDFVTLPVRIEQLTPVLPFDGTDSQAAEQYRLIRTRILQHPGRPRSIAVTSPGEGDGKTTTSINIAACLALKSDTSVLLVEADLRRPALVKYLGLSGKPGLVDVVEGKCSLAQAIIRVEQIPNLYVLPAGEVRRNPSELLDSAGWRELLSKLQVMFHYTIFDTPPAGSVADFALLQASVNGVVLVARPDQTSRSALTHSLGLISRSLLIGTVLNATSNWFMYRTPSYHYQGS